MEIAEHIPLAPLTTFQIGGLAQYLARVTNTNELQRAYEFAKEKSLNVHILGGGSNVLMPDEGLQGLVIKIEIKSLGLDEGGEVPVAVAGAGESWDEFVAYAITNKLWGVENLSGIPGTVGGAVAGNIGAYGQALSQTLRWVEVFDTQELTTQTLSNEACAFDYRDSFFKHTDRYIIVRAAFTLSRTEAPDLSYKDLAQRFEGQQPSLETVRSAVLEIRKGKFPDLSQEGTAGSFFKNPILEASKARALKETYPGMPLFEMPETSGIKIPLAWFLDYRNGVLDARNLSVGGARLFEKQPLVLVAQRNTRARDVEKLSETVAAMIKEKIGIEIEKEVRIL